MQGNTAEFTMGNTTWARYSYGGLTSNILYNSTAYNFTFEIEDLGSQYVSHFHMFQPVYLHEEGQMAIPIQLKPLFKANIFKYHMLSHGVDTFAGLNYRLRQVCECPSSLLISLHSTIHCFRANS